MSDRWVLAHDPRDGDVEAADWCLRHGQRADSCGPCFHEAQDDDEHEFWARTTPDPNDEARGAA